MNFILLQFFLIISVLFGGLLVSYLKTNYKKYLRLALWIEFTLAFQKQAESVQGCTGLYRLVQICIGLYRPWTGLYRAVYACRGLYKPVQGLHQPVQP